MGTRQCDERHAREVIGQPLEQERSNALWCAGYKSEFMLADRRYCYPLTLTAFVSRYLLFCEALHTTREHYAFAAFERAFQEFGLPELIRSDNDTPFSGRGAFLAFSELSVWWLRLEISSTRSEIFGMRHERRQPSDRNQLLS